MKIYFACSIKGEPGGLEDKTLIVQAIQSLGHNVLSEIFLNAAANQQRDGQMTPEEIYEWDLQWINEADYIVADVTRISMGVGYEIGWSLSNGKKVVALCKKDRYDTLTSMIKGCTHENFALFPWETAEDVALVLKDTLGETNEF